jgi:phosphohistidine phosphatase
MDLVLFRHADALNVGEAGIKTDEERPLSDKGKVRAKASARGLKALGLKPDLILSSPLVRARQTAEIVARETGLNGDVEICDALEPGGLPRDLLVRLSEAMDLECVICVGHLPDLGVLASQFVFGLPGVEIPIKKAGICHLEIVDSLDTARLVNFLSPQVLARLGE